ncbi:MAG: flagellar biosynthetic protein FliO [Actinomycetota bacterium]|nr:flagellar biosynthetic protein FliO [Actinomycetota bacterium]
MKTLPDVSVGHSLLQMVLALAVIGGSIWGLGKVLARVRRGPGATKRRATGDGLAVVSRQALGKDLSIATVRWGDREILVGIAGSTITFLDDSRRDAPSHARPVPHAADAPEDARDPASRDEDADAIHELFSGARVAERSGRDAPRAPLGAAAARPATLLTSLRDATLRR